VSARWQNTVIFHGLQIVLTWIRCLVEDWVADYLWPLMVANYLWPLMVGNPIAGLIYHGGIWAVFENKKSQMALWMDFLHFWAIFKFYDHIISLVNLSYNKSLIFSLVQNLVLSQNFPCIGVHATVTYFFVLLFISYKFVKGFLAITFLLLVTSSWNFHNVCQRFLYNQERNFSLIRLKMRNFPIDPHYKNCPLL